MTKDVPTWLSVVFSVMVLVGAKLQNNNVLIASLFVDAICIVVCYINVHREKEIP